MFADRFQVEYCSDVQAEINVQVILDKKHCEKSLNIKSYLLFLSNPVLLQFNNLFTVSANPTNLVNRCSLM